MCDEATAADSKLKSGWKAIDALLEREELLKVVLTRLGGLET